MQQKQHYTSQRIFTASEVAEFEYCPLVWWHERFEPLAHIDTEELFARLVELEHEHGPPASTLPEYQMVEQLLLRRGAFESDQQPDHGEEVSEIEEERTDVPNVAHHQRYLLMTALAVLIIALILIIVSLILAAQ